MSLTATRDSSTARSRRPAALIAVLLAAAMVVALVASDIVAGRRPQILLQVQTQAGEGIGFEPANVTAPARTIVELSFSNVSTVDHNLVFLEPLGVRTRAIVAPGASDRLEFETPSPGSYQFVCTIHEGMSGSLVVR